MTLTQNERELEALFDIMIACYKECLATALILLTNIEGD